MLFLSVISVADSFKTDVRYCAPALRGGKLAEFPLLLGVKCKYDPLFGNSRLDKSIRDAIVRAVALHPEFAVDDVHLYQTSMYASNSVTPDEHYKVAIRLPVKNGLYLDVAVCKRNPRLIFQNSLDQPPVVV